jgi:hypothetical protein
VDWVNHEWKESTMKVLVIANETAGNRALAEFVGERLEDASPEVLVIAPALIGRIDYWASDDRRARRAAQQRIDRCVEGLAAYGVEATGCVGDSDPLLAIEDALSFFEADEIVISTHAEGVSNWLARDVVGRARARFEQPVRHVAEEPASVHRQLSGTARTVQP